MITTNVMQRIFQMRTSEGTATCFTIDVDNKQYLCTAKHCFKNLKENPIELFYNNNWEKLPVSLVGEGSNNSDIVVLAPIKQISPSYPLPPLVGDLYLGQDLYFLGFPNLEDFYYRGEEVNRNFPIPFIKHAILSVYLTEKKVRILLLDGHNNPGFSGGPVVSRKMNANNQPEYDVVSIISAYKEVPVEVLGHEEKDTGLKAQTNSGIITSYGIKHALDAIYNNPIGHKVEY